MAGIIGGTVGGVLAVFLIIVCICCILRRKRLPEGEFALHSYVGSNRLLRIRQ